MINLGDIKLGDTFSTETKLLVKLGFTNNKGDSKKANIKEVKRYLSYEKTGKISRGKITNEIIITDIHSIPLKKVDLRINNGGFRENSGNKSDYVEDIKDLAIILANEKNGYVQYTKNEARVEFGLIPHKKIFEIPFKQERIDEFEYLSKYYYFLKSLFNRQIETTKNHFIKNGKAKIEKDYFTWEYEEEKNMWDKKQIASANEWDIIELIETFSFNKFKEDKKLNCDKKSLYYDRNLKQRFYKYKQAQFKKAFNKYYCEAILISSDSFVDRTKEEVLNSLKSKYRRDSIKYILGVSLSKKSQHYKKYKYHFSTEEQKKLMEKHDYIFGKENWLSDEIVSIKKDCEEKIKLDKIEVKASKKKNKKLLSNEEAQENYEQEEKYRNFVDSLERTEKVRAELKDLKTGSVEWIDKCIAIGEIDENDLYTPIELVDGFVNIVQDEYNSQEEIITRIKNLATNEQLINLEKKEDNINEFLEIAWSYGLIEKVADTLKRIDKLRQSIINDYIKRIENGEKFTDCIVHKEIIVKGDSLSGYINPLVEYNKFKGITNVIRNNLFDDIFDK